MQTSKVQFSPEELELAENAEVILTKNRIIKKSIATFASLADDYRTIAAKHREQLPSEMFELSPKVSRGEQYLELPYVMLDYPRLFSKEDVFAIRSFFWWGNYFSLTLHLKGVYKAKFAGRIKEQIETLRENNYWIGVSNDEWVHDVEEQHYVSLKEGGVRKLEDAIVSESFLKLVVKWPLQKGNAMQPLLKEQYSILLNVIAG